MSNQSSLSSFRSQQLKCEMGLADIIGHAVIWVILSIITLGFALFVFPYYMQRFIISRTFVYENDRKVGRLHCTIDFANILGSVILWTIISILTLGLGYFVFIYKISAHCFNHTKVVDI